MPVIFCDNKKLINPYAFCNLKYQERCQNILTQLKIIGASGPIKQSKIKSKQLLVLEAKNLYKRMNRYVK